MDTIPGLIYKIEGSALEIRIHNLIITIWMKEIHKDWAISMIYHIYKRGQAIMQQLLRYVTALHNIQNFYSNTVK
jgi:hypothetical protein